MHAASSPLEPLNKNILLAGEVIAEKWKIGEKIGEGTFSQIYSAYSIESRDKVAVKVEAPSSLKPVLEWESLILKSLQDCPHVCRYYYHGKHGDSTVLVMELLGESMSMLRMSPDSIHGVPLAKAVAVGLEMLDCIEAFHRHGYVHRDVKASNFALSANERNPAKNPRYYIIDFGLSRQHIGEDRKVLPARPVAEFRGTSMYASLSSHRRQELGPKDDLWSWFYLVMDFLRGELPWATDAQQKNRETVLSLKEHYTEKNPNLLVEGLPGAAQLMDMMKYLQSLNYEDFPDYALVRKQLLAVGESHMVSESSESGDEEAREDKKTAQDATAVSAIDWDVIESERERALQWTKIAERQMGSDNAPDTLLPIAKRYRTFFDSEGLSFEERIQVQSAVYRMEKQLRARTSVFAPPPIQSFVKRRQSEQKMRSDALRKRRERDYQVRQSLEIQNGRRVTPGDSTQASSEIVHGFSAEGTPVEAQNGLDGADPQQKTQVKTDSSMEVSDSENVGTGRPPRTIREGDAASVLRDPTSATDAPHSASTPYHQPPPPLPPARRWEHNHAGPIPPPPPPPGVPTPAQRPGGNVQPPPPPPPPLARRFITNEYAVPPPPPPGYPHNGNKQGTPTAHQPPPPSPRGVPDHRAPSASDRRYSAQVDSRESRKYRDVQSETREDRGYGYQQGPSPRESHGSEKELPVRKGKDRYYGDKRLRSPRESYSRTREELSVHHDKVQYYEERRPRSPRESHHRYQTEEPPMRLEKERYYEEKRSHTPRGDHSRYPVDDYHQEKERYYEAKKPRSPRGSHGHYLVEEPPIRLEKVRYYEETRPRSRSSRRSRRAHHRSYSRSSSRSRSRSYSRSVSSSRSRSPSPPPPAHSYRRSSRDYVERRESRDHPTDRHHVSQRVQPKREYSRRPRSRTRSESRSVSSSRSPSVPPTKRHRRSSDLSHSRSSHRPSAHSSSRRRSHSKDYDYHHRSPSPDYRRETRTRQPQQPQEQYRRSPSYDRHRSHSRDYVQEGEAWGGDVHFKPEKHRRSRWQPRS